jgi:malate permease and related proteins
MINLILLACCFLLGMFLRRTGRFSEATPSVLNGFVIYVSLPALTLLHIHKLQLDTSLLFTASMAWVLFGIGFLFFRFVGKWVGLSATSIGALMLVGGLGNTSFVGLPMIEAFYGKQFLGIGIIADQVGSFLVLSTLGILVATVYSSGDVTPRQMARKVLFFPPFQALVLAFVLKPFPYPEWVSLILQKLGDTLTPLALSSVGFQLRLSHIKGEVKNLGIGLFYKLLLGPALVTLLFVVVLGGGGKAMQVTLFEAAMAPMITAGIIAIDHELNPALVTLMLGIGIPLSFLTLTGWWWLLRGI